MDFKESRCIGDWLHKFDIVAEYNQPNPGVKERCARCGEEVVFPIDSNGNCDNNVYLSYHMRQALVPHHPLFKKEYPQYA